MAAGVVADDSKVFLETAQLRRPPATPESPARFGAYLARSGDLAAIVAPPENGPVEVHVFSRSGGQWQHEARIAPGFSGFEEITYEPAAIRGDTLLIGEPAATVSNRAGQGRVHVYRRTGGVWQASGFLIAADGTANAGFGESISISGTTVVVGQIGAAYVYEDTGTGFTLRAKLVVNGNCCTATAIDGDILAAGGLNSPVAFERVNGTWVSRGNLGSGGIYYGISLSVSGDRIAVGDFSGSQAHVYVKSGSAFTREAAITPIVPTGLSNFGEVVELQGNQLVVGAANEADVGRAYVFMRDPEGVWRQTRRLAASNIPQYGRFGRTLALDGTNLLVGAPSASVVFDFNDLPLADGVLLGNSIRNTGGSASDSAGESIAFANGLLIVGAPNGDDGGSTTGEAYVFALAGAPTGTGLRAKDVTLLAKLRTSTSGIGDKFGSAVAAAPDGNTIVIGSPGAAGGQGTVSVFRRPQSGWTTTTVADQVLPAPTGDKGITPAGFGSAVSLTPSGTMVVGAPTSDTATEADVGAVVTYSQGPAGFSTTPDQFFEPPVLQQGARFGDEVEATDTTLAVGAPTQALPGPLPETGGAFVYPAIGVAGVYGAPQALAPLEQATVGDKFGRSLGVRNKPIGATVVVGVPGSDEDLAPNVGTAVVYEDPGTGYLPVARLRTGGVEDDFAGTTLEISGDVVLVGAPTANRNGDVDTGTVYLFKAPPGGFLPAAAAAAKAQGKVGYGVVDIAPQLELPPAQEQPNQFFGTALSLGPGLAYVSAPARDVQQANGGINPDQGEIDVFVFDEVFASGFE